MTSHAAAWWRAAWGGPACRGAGMLKIDARARRDELRQRLTVKRGEIGITIDGTSGEVFRGKVSMRQPELTGDFGTLMGWADEVRRLKVRTNADTPADAVTARKFGAEGIGLRKRTEHMFFEPRPHSGGAPDDPGGGGIRSAAKPRWRNCCRCSARRFREAIFQVMEGLPVTIRLLDPPLHEFLPQRDGEIEEVAPRRRQRSAQAARPRHRAA